MGVNVTGYGLRKAIKKWTVKRDAAAGKFPTVLHKFKDEVKTSPEDVAAEVLAAETAIAKLQTAQVLYNAKVQVEVNGETVTLAEAVKRMGGATRIEKMWRTAAGLEKSNRNIFGYGAGPQTRNAGVEQQESTMNPELAVDRANQASELVSLLQEAIAGGNGNKVELDIAPTLL